MTDLWDYGEGEDLKPLEDSSEEGDDKVDYDELSCLPQHKRRKLQKLGISDKQLELIDLDEEENLLKKPAKHDKKTTKHKAAPESDSDLDLEFIPVTKRARETAPLDPLILQNQALIRRFQEAAQEPEIDDLLPEPQRPQPREVIGTAQPAAKRSKNGAIDSDSEQDFDDDEEEEQANEEAKVVLKLQCVRGTLQLRTKTLSAMSNLFTAFKAQAKVKGWISDAEAPKVKFAFEGDLLTGNETAESLDLEGDEIIEVKW